MPAKWCHVFEDGVCYLFATRFVLLYGRTSKLWLTQQACCHRVLSVPDGRRRVGQGRRMAGSSSLSSSSGAVRRGSFTHLGGASPTSSGDLRGFRQAALAAVETDPAVPGVQFAAIDSLRSLTSSSIGVAASGRELSPTALFHVNCLTRPIGILALAGLMDDLGCTLETPLSVLHPAMPSWCDPSVTIAEMLNHSAGLHKLDLAAWRITVPSDRNDLLPQRPLRRANGYATVLLGLLIAELIEKLSGGQPADEFVEEHVVKPLALTEHIVMSARRAQSIVAGNPFRLEAPIAYDTGYPLPFLSDYLPNQLEEVGVVGGGLASMQGMALLGRGLLTVLGGTPVAGLPSTPMLRKLLSSRRGQVFDDSLKKVCDFSGGFMIEPEIHGLGQGIPTTAFGHASMMPPAGLVVDPTNDIVAAVIVPGISSDPWHDIAIRHSLLGALWKEMLPADRSDCPL